MIDAIRGILAAISLSASRKWPGVCREPLREATVRWDMDAQSRRVRLTMWMEFVLWVRLMRAWGEVDEQKSVRDW